MNDFNLKFPPNFVGKWRVILLSEIGGTIECRRIFFDIVET